jgi:acyl-coenzyme A thioesterase PaaI-like protein
MAEYGPEGVSDNPRHPQSELENRRLHLYAQLGIDNQITGDMTAEATMPVGPGILTSGGIRAALLALLIEGSFGGNILQAGLFPVLDNMTVHIRDGGRGVEMVRSSGEIVRGAQRATAFGRVEDAGNPSRLLAYATIGYFMIKPRTEYMPRGQSVMRASDAPGLPREPDRSILDIMEMRVLPDEPVCQLDQVHAGVLAPEGRLHGGAHQLMHEAAALAAASRVWDTDAVRVRDFSIRFVKPAMRGPFEARASVLSTGATDLLCQVILTDRGADDRLRSLSTMRIGMADRSD